MHILSLVFGATLLALGVVFTYKTLLNALILIKFKQDIIKGIFLIPIFTVQGGHDLMTALGRAYLLYRPYVSVFI